MFMDTYTPQILCFLCHWCAYAGADSAGKARLADFGWTIAVVALFLLYSGPEVVFGVADVSATYLPVLSLGAVLGVGWRICATTRGMAPK